MRWAVALFVLLWVGQAWGQSYSGNITAGDLVVGGGSGKSLQDASNCGSSGCSLANKLYLNVGSFSPNATLPTLGALGLYVNESITGTCSSNCYYNYLLLNSDNVNTAGNIGVGWYFNHNFGGAAATGNRATGEFNLLINNTTGNTSPGSSYSGLLVGTTATVNDNGSSGTPTGQVEALNVVAKMTGATFWLVEQAAEFDVKADSSSSVKNKVGIQITELATDAVQGSTTDSAIVVTNQSGAVGWNNGILFGGQQGVWPLTTSGVAITCTSCGTLNSVIDFTGATINTALIKGPGPVLPSAIGGLTFALTQSNLGSPSGTMSNYAAGDSITLSCTGVTFSKSPVVGVVGVTTGAVTQATVAVPGITSGGIPSGTVSCAQASTTGSGTGYQVTATLGLIAAYVGPASLLTGGSAASNGNFFLNFNTADSSWAGLGGPENTFVGSKAGYGFTGTAGFNTAIGHNACGNGGTGSSSTNSVCVGTDSGRNIQTTFSGIVAVGSGSGRNASNIGSIYIGYLAGGSSGTNSAGTVTGNTNTIIGYQSASTLTSGSGNTCIGQRACSAITTGTNDIILGSGGASDGCANGNESNVFAVCPGNNGRVITVTGGGTPSTSVLTVAGTMNANNLNTGTPAASLCLDSSGNIIKKTTTGSCI